MPDMDYQDDQGQAEVFDETHLDDEGEGDLLLDEAEQILDVTQADGDADEEPFDEDDPRPHPRGLQGGSESAGARADHDHVGVVSERDVACRNGDVVRHASTPLRRRRR